MKKKETKEQEALRRVNAVHKWAARVGLHNDDPIWGEIFQSVRDSRETKEQQALRRIKHVAKQSVGLYKGGEAGRLKVIVATAEAGMSKSKA